jgi:hypothetical protein
MRLIDADALKKQYYPFPCAIGVENAVTIRAINEAPTIDAVPVVRGEWKRDIGDRHSSGEYRYCTACGGNAFHLYGMIRNYKYCPNCGAKMESEGNQ